MKPDALAPKEERIPVAAGTVLFAGADTKDVKPDALAIDEEKSPVTAGPVLFAAVVANDVEPDKFVMGAAVMLEDDAEAEEEATAVKFMLR